ncbi:hypothetical protein HNR42_001838 [Deinobacterium chartae]|uniref:Calcineurin-like phosphoesterase domain-containing protein n=1 Tax=Deinobacterium chartae TaxID=521158 RepID=A0A841I0B5_9DEIO|nr:metallophosphoesterase [Deinobacterium chartae]MBB6098404.1 hypothetical protein [Deinobacterium chartae]
MRRIPALTVLMALALLATPVFAQSSAPTAGFRAVLLSDFNGPYGSTTYPAALERSMQRILNEWKPDLLISAGDVVAGQKTTLPGQAFAEMWNAFDRAVAAPLRQAGIPYAFAVGNHDASSARGRDGRYTFAREREAASRYWQAHVPDLAFTDRDRFPFAYAFTFRGVFFAFVDASGPQVQDLEWLERTLASRAAREASMRIVVGHLSLYGVSQGRSKPGEVLAQPERFRALLERQGVHTYISGHHAAFYPGRRGALNLLASGGIGGRDYVGHPGTARSSVTVMDFGAGGYRLTSYDAVTGQEIPLSSLPPFLEGYGGRVERMDLR